MGAGVAAAAVLLSSCAVGEVLPVPATYYAKELCSCLFVVGQSEAYCRPYAQKDIAGVGNLPFVNLDNSAEIDTVNRRVTVSLLFQEATASRGDDRYGCTLEL